MILRLYIRTTSTKKLQCKRTSAFIWFPLVNQQQKALKKVITCFIKRTQCHKQKDRKPASKIWQIVDSFRKIFAHDRAAQASVLNNKIEIWQSIPYPSPERKRQPFSTPEVTTAEKVKIAIITNAAQLVRSRPNILILQQNWPYNKNSKDRWN